MDLTQAKNRDVMMAIAADIAPKLQTLTPPPPKKALEPPQIVQIQIPEPPPPLPAPEPLPTVTTETPITLAEPEPTPPENPQPPAELPQEPAPPAPSVDAAAIEAVTSETLGYLDMLGGEVFEQAPVSKYFDDWMVNLRQVILSFESSEVIGPDEVFTAEYNQIFGNIEDELSKRLLNEADIEVSARTLVENRYLLKEIDDGYAAQTKDLVVKGKSAIDYFIHNVQQIEAELAEVEQIKTSYRHPLKKMAKDQKLAELTQKLNAAKKRLALAVGNSAVGKEKSATSTRNMRRKKVNSRTKENPP